MFRIVLLRALVSETRFALLSGLGASAERISQVFRHDMFLQKVSEGFVHQFLKRGHTVAAKLHERLISRIVEFDDLAHLQIVSSCRERRDSNRRRINCSVFSP